MINYIYLYVYHLIMSQSVKNLLKTNKQKEIEKRQDNERKEKCRQIEIKHNREQTDIWFRSLCEDIINFPEKWKQVYDKIFEEANKEKDLHCEIITYKHDNKKKTNFEKSLYPSMKPSEDKPPTQQLPSLPKLRINDEESINDAIALALEHNQGGHLKYFVKQKDHALDELTFILTKDIQYDGGPYLNYNIIVKIVSGKKPSSCESCIIS